MTMILGEVSGFTPVIDVIADALGLIPAAVYGVVLRYCQFKDGVCYETLETLAEHLGCAPSTVQRQIRRLCQKGYLTDITPELRNSPHHFKITSEILGSSFYPNGKQQVFSAISFVRSIYVLESGKYTKIGITNNVTSRLRSLATSPPFPTSILGTIESSRAYELERALHDMFSGQRKGGEWFALSDTQKQWLNGWLNLEITPSSGTYDRNGAAR